MSAEAHEFVPNLETVHGNSEMDRSDQNIGHVTVTNYEYAILTGELELVAALNNTIAMQTAELNTWRLGIIRFNEFTPPPLPAEHIQRLEFIQTQRETELAAALEASRLKNQLSMLSFLNCKSLFLRSSICT